MRVQLTLHVNEHSLARCDIAHKHVAGAFERHRFAAHHPGAVCALAQAQRPYAERIAKRQQAVAGNHGDHRVRAFNSQMHAADG